MTDRREVIALIAAILVAVLILPARAAPADEYLKRGIALYRAKRYSEALVKFQYAVRVAPRHDEAWAWLGVTYIALGRNSEALAAFRRSVELNPRGRQAALARQWIDKLQANGPPPPALATPRGPIVRSLTELPPILQNQTSIGGGGYLFGQPYQVAVLHTNRAGLIMRTVYNLNGQYDRFEATVGVEDNGNLLQRAVAKVLGDGQVLFESQTLGSAEPPAKVNVSVRGVTRLELQTTALPVVLTVIWADPRLIKE